MNNPKTQNNITSKPIEVKVGFVGNPNSGKTTLFNAYTGAKLKVANWPGVTVEKKEGALKHHNHIYKLVDLPGIYSLTSYSIEEKISRKFILSDEVDVIVDVVDASNLERNLYLTLQLLETGKPIVLALNMMDIVEERGMKIDIHRLNEILKVPVIPVCAKRKSGLNALIQTVAHHRGIAREVFRYSDEIENKIAKLTNRLLKQNPNLTNSRFYAIKLLENDQEFTKNCLIKFSDIVDRNYESDIINQKYDFIEKVIKEVVINKERKSRLTEKVDNILTNKIWGVPIFFALMALVFLSTFTLGDAIKSVFEGWLDIFCEWAELVLQNIGAGKVLTSLIVDGIITGVGTILTFLPNIAILFLALALLEDSGYMARVSYVMNGIMNKIGLSGKAFIPMLLGFGCTVPAVMATRTLENKTDRLKTIFITPFMSCSAKIPIYVLLSGMFFGKYAAAAAFSMYFIGIGAGLLTAYVADRIINKTFITTKSNTLLIELPEYKTPNANSILIYVWENTKGYLSKAGTTIFLASVFLWIILNLGPSGYVEDMSLSFGASIGKFFVPLLAPIGLGFWQIGISLIAGLAAKEVVVSSMGILLGHASIDSVTGVTTMHQTLAAMGFGPLNAYSMMIFILFYTPCVAALAVIAKELKSVKWTAVIFIFQLLFAWVAAFLVFQIGSLF